MFFGENKEMCRGVCQPDQFFPYFFLLSESKLGISIMSLVDFFDMDFKDLRFSKGV
jgi:hypothetical protein